MTIHPHPVSAFDIIHDKLTQIQRKWAQTRSKDHGWPLRSHILKQKINLYFESCSKNHIRDNLLSHDEKRDLFNQTSLIRKNIENSKKRKSPKRWKTKLENNGDNVKHRNWIDNKKNGLLLLRHINPTLLQQRAGLPKIQLGSPMHEIPPERPLPFQMQQISKHYKVVEQKNVVNSLLM